jgi:predicted RND superfamily exporter protein
VFDPGYFGKRLGGLLADTFIRMALIVFSCTVILLFLFFRNIRLAGASFLPLLFSMICTLGVLGLSGRFLGISELMLSIVIMGMGIDYSLFFVRSYQRYYPRNPDSLSVIRRAVFLASASTLAGFGSLSFADHNLLKNAGLTSFLGIFFCLAGSFAILAPILSRIFSGGISD